MPRTCSDIVCGFQAQCRQVQPLRILISSAIPLFDRNTKAPDPGKVQGKLNVSTLPSVLGNSSLSETAKPQN